MHSREYEYIAGNMSAFQGRNDNIRDEKFNKDKRSALLKRKMRSVITVHLGKIGELMGRSVHFREDKCIVWKISAQQKR